MTASSREATVSPKKVPELDPTSSRYPLLNYSKSRIQLASVLVIMTSISKDTLYREQVERVWKWIILICVGSTQFLTCLRECFSIQQRLSTISSSTLTGSSIHLLFSPVLKIEKKHAGNGSFESKGSWWWCQAYVEVPFESWPLFFLPVLVQTVREGFKPHSEHLKIISCHTLLFSSDFWFLCATE